MTSLKAIIALSALAILFMVSGFGPSMSMPTDAQGRMSNCPFSLGTTSMCPMNFTQHIGYWQQLFASAMPVNTALTLLAMFAVVAFAIFSKGSLGNTSQKSKSTRLRKESNDNLKLFNPIISLFSDGILNPKIYSFSR